MDGGDHNASSKLTYYTKDKVHGMDLELISTQESLKAYLTVHSTPPKPHKGDEKKRIVELDISGEKQLFEAYCHEGGQRICLPENITTLIVETLSKNLSLKIRVPGYATTIHPEGFENQFAKTAQSPLFKNPFHLPF